MHDESEQREIHWERKLSTDESLFDHYDCPATVPSNWGFPTVQQTGKADQKVRRIATPPSQPVCLLKGSCAKSVHLE
jgi:hypothetical protein